VSWVECISSLVANPTVPISIQYHSITVGYIISQYYSILQTILVTDEPLIKKMKKKSCLVELWGEKRWN
jgi:hypothetical protein